MERNESVTQSLCIVYDGAVVEVDSLKEGLKLADEMVCENGSDITIVQNEEVIARREWIAESEVIDPFGDPMDAERDPIVFEGVGFYSDWLIDQNYKENEAKDKPFNVLFDTGRVSEVLYEQLLNTESPVASASELKSWKLELILEINNCTRIAENREMFIEMMKDRSYGVGWNDERRYITFTTPDGNVCRNSSLYPSDRFTKEYLLKQFEDNHQKNNQDKLKTFGALLNSNQAFDCELIIGDVDMPASFVWNAESRITPYGCDYFKPLMACSYELLENGNISIADCNEVTGEKFTMACAGYISTSEFNKMFSEVVVDEKAHDSTQDQRYEDFEDEWEPEM